MHNFTQYCFYRYLGDPSRRDDAFDILWNLFECALNYAKNQEESFAKEFTNWYKKALELPVIERAKMTMGLFHIRPNTYVNLDSKNKDMIKSQFGVAIWERLKNADTYLQAVEELKSKLANISDYQTEYPFVTFSEFSWDNKNNFTETTKDKSNGDTTNMENINNELLKQELNLILYGPPGTGKTYNTIPRALSIIDKQERGLDHWKKEYQNNKSAVMEIFRNEIDKKEGHIAFVTFHQSYGYEEFIEGIKPDLDSKEIRYKKANGVFKEFCNRADETRKKVTNQENDEENNSESQTNDNYVFIIDEINRGNVSKIFGELITLIEPTKRLGADEEMKCTLPYSGDKFGVPKNVYILGTMNTADRSLVQLDAALRRRFAFEEMTPDYKVIKKNVGLNGIVAEIDIAELLEAINERITVRLDREHQIGHSYFMDVKSVDDLAYVFRQKIIPLLQEYFFDDYEAIKEVLSKDFINEKEVTVRDDKKTVYDIKKIDEMPKTPEAYQKLYEHRNLNDSENEG